MYKVQLKKSTENQKLQGDDKESTYRKKDNSLEEKHGKEYIPVRKYSKLEARNCSKSKQVPSNKFIQYLNGN